MFSKFAKNKQDNSDILSWKKFYNDNVDLTKLKVPELKEISRQHKLKLTGTKPKLIEYISFFFKKNKVAVHIQRILRGFFARKCILLQGFGLHNRKNCVNETDFYSLEPLDEIPNNFFYSYTDDKNFTYGFNIESLLIMIRKQGRRINNPYNREPIENRCYDNIIKVVHLINIVYNNEYTTNTTENLENNNVLNSSQNNILNIAYDINNVFNINRIQNSLQPRQAILARIINIRQNPIERRIQDVFIEIDLLGNYSQSSWFSTLNRMSYYRFYQYIYYIWFTSGMLTYQIKREICPFFDPFVFQVQHTMNPSLETTNIDEAREFCLSVIENFVYGGIDIEYRRIAVLHILSALTMVSIPARNNMIWLYDSLNNIIPT